MSNSRQLRKLLIEEIFLLYSSESQQLIFIHRSAKGFTDEAMLKSLDLILEESRKRLERLDQLLAGLEVQNLSEIAHCCATKGALEDNVRAVASFGGFEKAKALVLLNSILCLQHLTASSYGTAIMLARAISEPWIGDLLQTSLSEEQAAIDRVNALLFESIYESLN